MHSTDLWHRERHVFASIEDEESLRLKARYVREQDLAGVMFWEYFGDPSGRLLQTLSEELVARREERRN